LAQYFSQIGKGKALMRVNSLELLSPRRPHFIQLAFVIACPIHDILDKLIEFEFRAPGFTAAKVNGSKFCTYRIKSVRGAGISRKLFGEATRAIFIF